jgi:hypothetical protein
MRARDVSRWATPLCAALTPAHGDASGASTAAQLLAGEVDSTVEAVLRHHALLRVHVPLAAALAALPAHMHAAAACCHVRASTSAPACALPLADIAACEAVLRVLPAVPQVTRLELVVPPECVEPEADLPQRIVDALAPRLHALPQLRAISLVVDLASPSCYRYAASASVASASALARHLPHLTQLQHIALCSYGPDEDPRLNAIFRDVAPPLRHCFAALPSLSELSVDATILRSAAEHGGGAAGAAAARLMHVPFCAVTRLALELEDERSPRFWEQEMASIAAEFANVRSLAVRDVRGAHNSMLCCALSMATAMTQLTRMELSDFCDVHSAWLRSQGADTFARLVGLRHLALAGHFDASALAAALAPLTRLTHLEFHRSRLPNDIIDDAGDERVRCGARSAACTVCGALTCAS